MHAELLVQQIDKHGPRIAVSDGIGVSSDVWSALVAAATHFESIELMLGWCTSLPDTADLSKFSRVSTFMGGYKLRHAIKSGDVAYLPIRVGSLPTAISGYLRPDIVLCPAIRTGRGLCLGSSVAWLPSAIDVAKAVLVEIMDALPDSSRNYVIPPDKATVLNEHTEAMPEVFIRDPTAGEVVIAEKIVSLFEAGATLQIGPGALGSAVVEQLALPVRIDSGVVTDAVVDLDERQLLLGNPIAPYILGSSRLYEWADGRPILERLEWTHDISRLSAIPAFFSVNTALEVDITGQINVEGVGDELLAGVGGHADYALAASRSRRGLSIVGVESHHASVATLVSNLTRPVSTPRMDIDVVVTERGMADLRGKSDESRRKMLLNLWFGS